MEWKLQKINLLRQNGEITTRWAIVNGNIAIHKALVEKEFWSISHVQTSGVFKMPGQSEFLEREEIPQVLKFIFDMNLGGQKLVDMPACEILNCIPLFEEKYGYIKSKTTKNIELMEKFAGCRR